MASNFNGQSWLNYGFLAAANWATWPWTTVVIFRASQVAVQASIVTRWDAAGADRQFALDHDRTWVRLRHGNSTIITVPTPFAAGDWMVVGVVRRSESASDGSIYCYNLTTGTFAEENDLDYVNDYTSVADVRIAARGNAGSEIPFEGDVAEAGFLNTAWTVEQFLVYVSTPREALDLYGGQNLMWHPAVGEIDAVDGRHIDWVARNNGTPVGGSPPGIGITPGASPPVSYETGPWLGRSMSSGPPPEPPTFVAAWAKQSTIGAGFETAA